MFRTSEVHLQAKESSQLDSRNLQKLLPWVEQFHTKAREEIEIEIVTIENNDRNMLLNTE